MTETAPSSDVAAGAAAPLEVRRAADIYARDGGWYRAHWHFSFERYHDAANMGIGKLRLLNDDILLPAAAWPMHPHQDIEAVTYVVAGLFEHQDNLGERALLPAGTVQRMTLGAGAEHAEKNASDTAELRFIQLWIYPNRHGLPSSIERRTFAPEDRRNRLLRAVHPEGEPGPGVTVHQDVSVFLSLLDPEATVEHRFAAERGGYCAIIDGVVRLNGERLAGGDAVRVLGAGRLAVRAEAPSELILIDTPLPWALMI